MTLRVTLIGTGDETRQARKTYELLHACAKSHLPAHVARAAAA